ncbi:MAG: FG-GAP-like repeat-containing protein, partial [Psychrosphaera sp.]|nr:FG-GAP-like repeat-containing protein [Psychrosphaera sp.]
SGSDVDGSIALYQWSQTSGTTVSLSDNGTANPHFTAPDLDTGSQSLSFELTVTDNEGLAAKDSVIVTVNNVNIAPVAQAGESLVVDESMLVTLTGAGTDEDGSIVSYEWVQTDGETVSLSDVTSATPSFNSPVVVVDSVSLSFKLTVTDNDGNTANDSVEVVVNSTNSAPVVNAGSDKSVAGNSLVQLDGSSSDSDGTINAYLWTQVDGISMSLSDATIVNPTFTAPAAVNGGLRMTFQLQVTDERDVVVKDTVTITVSDYPSNPYSGATVQAGEKILWSFPTTNWTDEFIVESEASVALNIDHVSNFYNDRWLIAPVVAEPVQVSLLLKNDTTGNELLDTVTILPIEQFGFKPLTTIENFYQNSGFGAANGSLLSLIDNDTLPDLILYNSDSISWFKGKGDGTFGTQTALYTAQNIQRVTFEDINNDAQEDLVVKLWGGEDNSQVVWLEKQFTPIVEFATAKTIASNSSVNVPRESAIVDIDGDGRVDFVNFYEHDNVLTLSFYRQEADGSFSSEVLIDQRTQTINSGQLSIGDHNGDNLLDLKLYLSDVDDDGLYTATLTYYNQGNGGGFDIPDAEFFHDYNNVWGSIYDV